MPLITVPFSRLYTGTFLSLFLLVGLTVSVNYFGMFYSFDNSVLQFLLEARTPLLTQIFLVFTFLGNPSFVLPLATLLGLFFLAKKEFYYFILFFGTIFGSSLFWFFLKIITNRSRPTLFSPLVSESAPSFPSGHAALSVAFFGLLAYLFAGGVKTHRARINIFFVWIFIVFGIGLSRLYLGVHYPTDVLAGYLSGLFFLFLGIGLFEQLTQKRAPADKNDERSLLNP
jgi:undecaprenyl-diphosphatase